MRTFTKIVVGLGALGLLVFTGCSGSDVLSEKDRDYQELKRLYAVKQESLREKLQAIEELRAELDTSRQETAALRNQVSVLETTVRAQNAKMDEVGSNKAALESKLAQTSRALDRLTEEHARVKEVASATATELADLRLKRQELVDRAESANGESATFRKENVRLLQEIDQLRADLVKERAALHARSIREPGAHANTRAKLLTDRLRELEQEVVNLRSEKASLLGRIQNLEGEGGAPRDTRSGAAQVTPVSQAAPERAGSDDEATLGNFFALVAHRAKKAFRGEAVGDTIDIGLLASTFVLSMFAFWVLSTPLRWRRRRRIKNELKTLRRRASQKAAGARPGQGAAGRAHSVRSRATRRGEKFSPIVSEESYPQENTVDEDESTAMAPDQAELFDEVEESGETEEQYVTVSLGAPETPVVRATPVPRKVRPQTEGALTPEDAAGASVGDPQGEDEEDQFASTQVIPSYEDIQEEPVVSAPPANAPGSSEKRQGPDASGKGGGTSGGDRELLAELKKMIGQKFDEYTK